MALTFQEVDQILRIVEEFPATEVRFEYGDLKLYVRRAGAGGALPAAPIVHSPARPAEAPAAPAARKAGQPAPPLARQQVAAELREGFVSVSSPMMGVFYAAPSPDAAPFVTVGQEISKGTDLCIIEVMKIMNMVKAPCAGTVVEVAAANGETVQSGAPLFWIRPHGAEGAP